jgi:hypothetical protein
MSGNKLFVATNNLRDGGAITARRGLRMIAWRLAVPLRAQAALRR